MSWFYPHILRPLLFLQDSESVHDRTLNSLAWAARHDWLTHAIAAYTDAPPLPMKCMGMSFPNPVGLAAGMDKRGAALPIWHALGFGFAEIGGVTWHAQEGNPRPRMFREPTDEALINRMGFNNPGAPGLAERLQDWRQSGLWPCHPVGINLGKSKITPLEEAAEDYTRSFECLETFADFFVVNVSSPNTPNLRDLQDADALRRILVSLGKSRMRVAGTSPVAEGYGLNGGGIHGSGGTLETSAAKRKPLLVKVAPDLSWTALDQIIEVAMETGVDGIVATNTTITRPTDHPPRLGSVYQETGGLSGRPLARRSTEVIRHLYRQSGGRLPIIGVGGIFTADDAWEKVTAGASLIQIYSSLVYRGPGVVREIVEGLLDRLGNAKWSDVVGTGSDGVSPT
jgi:dihydroorotate dehydrogenase